MGKHSEKIQRKNNLFQILTFIIVAMLLIYSCTLIIKKIISPDQIPSFLGYKNFIISSGSMEPTLKIGDIIIVKENEQLSVNDIISFNNSGNAIVTHRIIEIIEKDNNIYYKTKGDANNSSDEELLEKENIEGKYVFKIPKVGKAIMFLQTKAGLAVVLLVLAVIYLIINKKKSNH